MGTATASPLALHADSLLLIESFNAISSTAYVNYVMSRSRP
jgi:hypothetical protein